MNNRPIGIFDSGVGGLSVFLEIQKLLPQESIIYLADSKNVPYGTKTPEELTQITEKIVKFLLKKDVKAIIIACNTATVYTIENLRSKFDIPIIGTVPLVKTISENTKTGKVAVFSTPATAKSKYLKDLIKKFADDKKVYVVGETGLEALVEQGDIDSSKIKFIFNKYLIPLKEKNVDCIALACTHYHFVKKNMQKVLGKSIKIFDSGAAVARQAKRVLESNRALSDQNKVQNQFYTTGSSSKFKSVAEKLLNIKLEKVEQAEI